jgi:nucleotide-binding universal stress UspA family protein
MDFGTILVPIEEHGSMKATLETTLLLARKFDSYIEGFALRVTTTPAYAVADVGAAIPQLEQDIAENTQPWLEDAPEDDRFVGSHGRLFDVIVLGRPGRDPKGPRLSTLEAALFESGRPVLIAPPSPPPDIGRNVLIAWNCSTEQARTIAFAMPILKRANRVVVLTVEGGAAVPGPTGQQLCHYLQLSGVSAKPLTVGLGGRLTGEAVLAHAKALSCDLLIKGAYTQSRLRQFIFGGTTRYILNNAGLPVFMAN